MADKISALIFSALASDAEKAQGVEDVSLQRYVSAYLPLRFSYALCSAIVA